ncbi:MULTISPECIES: hypothetical protein [Bacillus]|uniref:hypothetical protein n=1 Tax=Bacillus TaxID=1386 RepID=UPI0002D24569|nr:MULTISPECIES: hypothetical protein [Bacillus]MEB9338168.1 hypothetical protein [Bacillus cereus]CCW08248.1 hypothetical protein EBGED10_49780 [Bacillus sp. GeD10]
MDNMIQKEFHNWNFYGPTPNIEQMKNTHGGFISIPVSCSISQMISVQENSSYVFQFKINNTPDIFRIFVKEWWKHLDGITSSGKIYEFDHNSPQCQYITTGPTTNTLEIKIENKNLSPLTIQSIELAPTHHTYPAAYNQQHSDLFQEKYKNPQMDLSRTKLSALLSSYLDLSAVNGLSFSEMRKQAQTIFERLLQSISPEPLHRLLRWLNLNKALQVVPMENNSVNEVVSFHGPDQRIIMKIQHKNDLDTIDFIENVLYGLGLALDVYAGNRASDHPKFQQLIQQEKERYRDTTGYVFTGDYHDIFAQIFTSLYSPYEDVRKQIAYSSPLSSHYIQNLFESYTPLKSNDLQTTNKIHNSDNYSNQQYPYRTTSLYNYDNNKFIQPRVEIDDYGIKDEETVKKYHEERYQDLERELSPDNKKILKDLSDRELAEINKILIESNAKIDPMISRDLDDILSSNAAKLTKNTVMYVDLSKNFGFMRGVTDWTAFAFMEDNSYLFGSLKPLQDVTQNSILLKVTLPKGESLGFMSDATTVFTNRNQTFRITKYLQQSIHGQSVPVLEGESVQEINVSVYKNATVESANKVYKKYMGESADSSITFVGVSEVEGPYASLILNSSVADNITPASNFTSAILSNFPYKNVLESLLGQMDIENKGVFRFTTANKKYWEKETPYVNEQGAYYPNFDQYIEIDFSDPTQALFDTATRAYYGRELFSRALDNTLLKYTNSAPGSQFSISSLADSPSFQTIFQEEAGKFKRTYYKDSLAPTPQAYFDAVMAYMHSTREDEQKYVEENAPLAYQYIKAKLEATNNIIDAMKDPEEYSKLLQDFGRSWLDEKNPITDLFVAGKLTDVLETLENNLNDKNGLIEDLSTDDQYLLQQLATMFLALTPIPKSIVSYADVAKVQKELGGSIPPEADINNDSDNMMTGLGMHLLERESTPIEISVPPGTKLMDVPNADFILMQKPNANIFRQSIRLVNSSKTAIRAQFLDEKQVIGKIQTTQDKLNEAYRDLRKFKNKQGKVKYGDILDLSLLKNKPEGSSYIVLDKIKQMTKTLIDKSNIPKDALKAMFNRTNVTDPTTGFIQITREPTTGSTMPDPFKSIYDIDQDQIKVEMIRKSQTVEGLAVRDFTADAIFAGGSKLFLKYFRGTDLDKQFASLEPGDLQAGLGFISLGEIFNDTNLAIRHSVYFGLMMAYMYGPDPAKQKLILSQYPDYCKLISRYLNSISLPDYNI